MNIAIKQVDSKHTVELDGIVIKNVVDFNLLVKAQGTSELMLKMEVPSEIKSIEMSASPKG